jgi:hypothetical protein
MVQGRGPKGLIRGLIAGIHCGAPSGGTGEIRHHCSRLCTGDEGLLTFGLPKKRSQ